MAFAKQATLINVVPIFDAVGAVLDVRALMSVNITENGTPTVLVYVASISVWAGLTPTQQTQLAAVMNRIKQIAMAADVPIPLTGI
jgi:hypothetical protein